MVRWHHRLDGHEFEQALGVGDGQEIFPTQGLNMGLPHCRQMLYCLSHQEVMGPDVKPIASGHLLYRTERFAWCSLMTWMGCRGQGGPRGKYICMHVANSLLCTTETNTTP